jgi:hypothetical protein
MSRFYRAVLAGILLIAVLSGTAAAEITLPVNDNNTGLFDQPSVTMDGATARIAFIGDNTASGVYKVYYAAVNGNTNFANLSLVRDNTVLLTSATAVDNSTSPNDAYYDARHPKIAMRSSTEAVILFQAKPAVSDTVYRPYIAKLTLSGNTVTSISVRKMIFASGVLDTVDIEDLSFGIVTSDNSARIAFGTKSAIGASETFQVYFARVGLDNATVVGTPIQLSSLTNSDGLRPLPSLRLDTVNRAHVAWAANFGSSGPAPVYYAMVKETNGVDNRVISATQVIGGGFRWGFPSVQVFSNSSIVVLAADETVSGQAGNIGFINFNPDADNQDGTPVQVATNTAFFITPPGELILPDEFNLYRPDAFLDSSGRIHMTGYGVGGTRCTYYAFHLITTSPFYEIQTTRSQAGFDSLEYPREISGDYTRAAFGFLSSGKVIVFWSGGLTSGGSIRNIDVSTVATTAIVTPSEESGCSMVADPRSGERGRIAGAAFLFLPAVVLAVRRISRGRRKARRRTVV